MVNSWNVSVLKINKSQREQSGYIWERVFLFCFFFSVMARGSLWTVDQQLSLTDKLPAREREGTQKHKKKDEWNKEWASSAVCDWEGLHFTVKSTAKGVERGCRSWQIGNERVVLKGGGWKAQYSIRIQPVGVFCTGESCESMLVAASFSAALQGR